MIDLQARYRQAFWGSGRKIVFKTFRGRQGSAGKPEHRLTDRTVTDDALTDSSMDLIVHVQLMELFGESRYRGDDLLPGKTRPGN